MTDVWMILLIVGWGLGFLALAEGCAWVGR